MEISNYKKVRLSMQIIITLIMIFMTGSIVLFLLQIPEKKIIFIIIIMITMMLAFIFINLKIFMYEDSGEVITIKFHHPLESKLHCRTIEFPSKKLKSYLIKKAFHGYEMSLILESHNKKEVQKKIFITGLTKVQNEKIKYSLEQITETNKEDDL